MAQSETMNGVPRDEFKQMLDHKIPCGPSFMCRHCGTRVEWTGKGEPGAASLVWVRVIRENSYRWYVALCERCYFASSLAERLECYRTAVSQSEDWERVARALWANLYNDRGYLEA